MTNVYANSTINGIDYCPHCSNPPCLYVYHLPPKCPKLEPINYQDQIDALNYAWQNLPIAKLVSNDPQPPPQQNDGPIVWDLVIQDMKKRDEMGTQKYHTHLQPFNGRDALLDAYQEALDLVVYLRQLIYEKYKE